MPIQYLQNNSGQTTAVVIPIEEWKVITQKHTDLAELENRKTERRKKPSDFKGILSPETADAMQKHVQESRDQWD